MGGVAEADTDRMKPELDDRSIVELIYLSSHGDKTVAALDLLNILLSGCLCGYLTQHCLGECGAHTERERDEGGESVRISGKMSVGRRGVRWMEMKRRCKKEHREEEEFLEERRWKK